MTEDELNQQTLAVYMGSLAKQDWVPNRVLTDREGSAIPGSSPDARPHRCVCIYIREDGFCIGSPREYVDALEGLSDKWIGMISGGNPVSKHLWTLQQKSSHGYWINLGRFDPWTGETVGDIPKAASESPGWEVNEAPDARDVDSLRAWLRKGVS